MTTHIFIRKRAHVRYVKQTKDPESANISLLNEKRRTQQKVNSCKSAEALSLSVYFFSLMFVNNDIAVQQTKNKRVLLSQLYIIFKTFLVFYRNDKNQWNLSFTCVFDNAKRKKRAK